MDAGQNGHIVAKLWLLFDKLSEAYSYIKHQPKGIEVDSTLAQLNIISTLASKQWIIDWARARVVERLDRESLQMLCGEQWSNAACCGNLLLACDNSGLSRTHLAKDSSVQGTTELQREKYTDEAHALSTCLYNCTPIQHALRSVIKCRFFPADMISNYTICSAFSVNHGCCTANIKALPSLHSNNTKDFSLLTSFTNPQ